MSRPATERPPSPLKPSPPNGYRSDATVRLQRLFRLLVLIRQRSPKRPVRVQEILSTGSCSRATVYRDLQFLMDEGLVAADGQGGYLLLDRGLSFPMAPLTAEDALALALARAVLDRPDVPMRAEVGAALDRAASAFSPRMRELFRRAAESVRATPSFAGDLAAAPLATLISCWLERRTVTMDYDSAQSGRRWRKLDPYQVTAEGGYWMVQGWCHENRAILSFALDRVYAAERTDDPAFTRDETAWATFLAEEGVFLGLRGGGPVTVRVRFAPAVARYALRPGRWPRGLIVTEQPDGSALLTGTALGVDGILVELLRWRRHAVVEGGPELWHAYCEELAAMAAAQEKIPPSH